MKKSFKLLPFVVLMVCLISMLCITGASAADVGAIKEIVRTDIKQTSIKLDWNDVSGASGYQVWMLDDATDSYVLEKTVTNSHTTLKDLDRGLTSKVRVRAYKIVSGKVKFGDYKYTTIKTVPAKPAKVRQYAAAQTSVTVKWNKSEGATGYRLYVKYAGADDYVLYKSYTGTKATVRDLPRGTTVRIKVSTYRNIFGATYETGKTSYVEMQTLPSGAVKDLAVNSTGVTVAELSWSAVKDANQYVVYASTDNGTTWSAVQITEENVIKLKGLTACTEYLFKVCPCVVFDETIFDGKFSSEVSAITSPTRVSGVTVSNVTNNSVTVKWKATSGQTGYSLEILRPGATEYEFYSSVKGTTKNVTNLEELSVYSFRVRGYYLTSAGETVWGAYNKDPVTVTTDDSKVDSIEVTSSKKTVWVGNKRSLTATVLPSYAADKTVTWHSTDTDIATVSKTGYVTGVSAGKVKIFAKSADGEVVSNSYEITVKQHVESLNLAQSSVSLSLNEDYALDYEILPHDANNRKVSFKSSNTSVATVTSNGYIKAVGTGTAKITVTSDDVSTIKASCTINVTKKSVTSISMPETLTIYAGQTCEIKPVFSPSNASNKDFTISLSNYTYLITTYKWSDYIMVSGNKITGIKASKPAIGSNFSFKMTVTSKDGQFKDTCEVTVISATTREKPTGVTILTSDSVWYPGKIGQLAAVVTPATATDQSVTWKSSKNSVARVDSNGRIICLNPGEAVITATTNDQQKVCTYKIVVEDRIRVSNAEMSYSEYALKEGDTFILRARITPYNANITTVTWASSNKNVATVSSSGIVKAKSPGSTVITATTTDGGYVASCAIAVVDLKFTGTNYHENLNVGDKVQLTAEFQPAASAQPLVWSTSDENVAKVTQTGEVTIVGEGGAYITVRTLSNKDIYDRAIVRTDTFTPPENTPDTLLQAATTAMNRIKTVTKPETTIVNSFIINQFNIKNTTFAEDLINEAIKDSLTSDPTISKVSIPKGSSQLINRLPISGSSLCIADGLNAATDLNASKTKLSNSKTSSTYTITLWFADEKIETLPTNPISQTKHGKAFDIFTKSDVDSMIGEMVGAGLEMSYREVTADYTGCSIVVTLDKLSNEVVGVVYDQNMSLILGGCKMAVMRFSLTGDITIGTNTRTEISFNY